MLKRQHTESFRCASGMHAACGSAVSAEKQPIQVKWYYYYSTCNRYRESSSNEEGYLNSRSGDEAYSRSWLPNGG
jgi:hypothetical protein